MDEEMEIGTNETLSLLYWIAAVLNIIAAIFFLIAPHVWQIMSLLEVMANKSIFAEAWGIITPGAIALALYVVAIAFLPYLHWTYSAPMAPGTRRTGPHHLV